MQLRAFSPIRVSKDHGIRQQLFASTSKTILRTTRRGWVMSDLEKMVFIIMMVQVMQFSFQAATSLIDNFKSK